MNDGSIHVISFLLYLFLDYLKIDIFEIENFVKLDVMIHMTNLILVEYILL